jgi:hypothetical protein
MRPIIAAAAIACACTSQAPPVARVQQINVAGLDYAFQLPDSLGPGPTSFRFSNTGKVPHEMILALLKPGVTLSQLMAHAQAGGNPQELTDGMAGILVTGPGTETIGALHLDLLPGRTYVWACFFQDSPDAKPHSELGMVASRTIAQR